MVVLVPWMWTQSQTHWVITLNMYSFLCQVYFNMGFPHNSTVKNPPTMQEMQEVWVQSLGWENPPEEGMVIHSSILAWRIPQTEEPGRLRCIGSQRVRHDWAANTNTHPTNTIISMVLHTNKFIILFTQIIHKKQRNKKKWGRHFKSHSITWYLETYGSISYITTAFRIATGYSRLEIKILFHCTLYSTIK